MAPSQAPVRVAAEPQLARRLGAPLVIDQDRPRFEFRKIPEPYGPLVKILCTADIHIGRRPSRLPSRIDTGPLSCARAWSSVVERAIAERVQLVAIAGDLVDHENRFYEAAGPVEAGVRSLASHGIRTVAVAGNHDHDTLPWLADRFDPEEFTLLGRGGKWERVTLEVEGRPALHVDGWSFPTGSHPDDPLRGYPYPPHDGLPVMGLLHADLDQPGSRHAPVEIAALRALPVGFWLLGHVHRHSHLEQAGAASVLYPGSPQAMDPGEPGAHGPWLLEIDSGGRFTPRHLPLSQVRYERLQVDVEGAVSEGEIRQRIVEAVSSALLGVENEAGPLRYLSLRLRLVGRTPLHRLLQASPTEFVSDLELSHGSVSALVERVVADTRPQRDLEELARGSDAPALLAHLVRALERDQLEPEQARLLQAVTARAADVRTTRPYLPLDDSREPPDREALNHLVREHALLLLDELLAEREVA